MEPINYKERMEAIRQRMIQLRENKDLPKEEKNQSLNSLHEERLRLMNEVRRPQFHGHLPPPSRRSNQKDERQREEDFEARRQLFLARYLAEEALNYDPKLKNRKRTDGSKPLDLLKVKAKYDELFAKHKDKSITEIEFKHLKAIAKYINLLLEKEKKDDLNRLIAEKLAKEESAAKELESKKRAKKFAGISTKYLELLEKKKAEAKPPSFHPDQTHKVLENGDIEITLPDGGTIITDASTVEITSEDLKEAGIDSSDLCDYLFEITQREWEKGETS